MASKVKRCVDCKRRLHPTEQTVKACCMACYQRRRRAANPEGFREAFRRWNAKEYANNPDYRERRKKSAKAWRVRYPERFRQQMRAQWLRRQYRLTVAEYEKMAKRQKGHCAICGEKKKRLVIDHCHKTGRVRDLLCYRCNHGIGYLGDSIQRMKQIVAYLEKHKKLLKKESPDGS